MDITLRLSALTRRFGPTTAVDNVDLAVRSGEFVVLLGPSGCGKTTTLRMIAGFLDPTEGGIYLGDRVLSEPGKVIPPERRHMGMVFQSYAVWPHMSVMQNVAYGLRLRNMRRGDADVAAREALSLVQMQDYGDRYPSELSGGQQQRVALARALAVDPGVLLMDEPLSNLDAKLRDEMRMELRRLHDTLGFTAVYVTHDQTEAMTIGDRIVVLRDGMVEQSGTPIELHQNPRNSFVASFLGSANIVSGTVEEDPRRVRVGDALLECVKDTHSDPGTRVDVAIRPEAIQATDSRDGGDSVLHAAVEETVFLGSSISCKLRFPALGQVLTAALNPYTRVQPGSGLQCRVRAVSVLEPDTERSGASASSIEVGA